MNGVRTPNRLGACLREPEKAHLALAYQICHRADCFFNRRFWIDPMLIVEIDHVHTEPAQTFITGFADVIWFAADTAVIRPFRVAHDPKFRCNSNLLTMASECPPDELFIRVRTIHVCGIE